MARRLQSRRNGNTATSADYLGNGATEQGVVSDNEMQPLDLAASRAAREQYNKIVSWTKQQFTLIKAARQVQERQWYTNMLFYYGRQNVQPIRATQSGQQLSTTFYVPPAPPWRSRPVINRIRKTIRYELAQLTNNKPTATVIPASAEDRDMYAAWAGEQIWDSLYREHKVAQTVRNALWWTTVCGNGFIKTYWDSSKGERKPAINSLTGLPDHRLPAVPEGDVCFTHETPFHILVPDLREVEIENEPFVIHAQTKSPEWVRMHWQQALDGSPISYQGSAQAGEVVEESFLNMMGTQTLQKQHSMLVLEVWVKPGFHPMFPQGAYYTLVGDQLVQAFQGWPYKHGQYPFAKLDHIPGGKFYSSSVLEDLIPLQKEYNRTRGQLIEYKNKMAKPQLMAPRGAVDASKITTEPGLLVEFTPGFDPPTPIPLASLPSYVVQEIDRIINDWNDISGQHEVSQGQVPPGVTAATAISYLQERDESQMSHTFDSLEEANEKIARQALSLVNQFWNEERLIKVTGPDGSFDAMAFKGSDIERGMDIRTEAGSALPVSKAAKQALITDWMKMQFISPQDGLSVLEMGGISKIYERIQVDERQVQRENLKMAKVTPEMLEQYNKQNNQLMQKSMQEQQMEIEAETAQTGLPPMETDPETGEVLGPKQPNPFKPWDGNTPPLIVPTNTWDDHGAHIKFHNDYRKGQAFENLPQEIKTLFEMHVQEHIAAMGIEMVTQDPAAASGLPPEIMAQKEEEEGQESSADPQENGQPGPNPMPSELGPSSSMDPTGV